MDTVRRVDEPDGDPTLDEMREYLTGAGFYEPDDAEDPEFRLDCGAEVAIWYFACHYHGGAGSNLYRVLSIDSPYHPGPLDSWDDEDDSVKLVYDALVARFIPKPSPA